MSENLEVNCPYCGEIISNSVEQCPHCKEFFKEPYIPNIKFTSIYLFLFLNTLTCGLFGFLWVLINYKALTDIASQKDIYKFKILTIISLVIIFCIFTPIFLLLIPFIYLISYRILRILEKFALKKYNAPIIHNEAGFILFNIAYVVYFVDTFKERIYEPYEHNFLSVSGWFKVAILLVFLSIIFLMFSSTLIQYITPLI